MFVTLSGLIWPAWRAFQGQSNSDIFASPLAKTRSCLIWRLYRFKIQSSHGPGLLVFSPEYDVDSLTQQGRLAQRNIHYENWADLQSDSSWHYSTGLLGCCLTLRPWKEKPCCRLQDRYLRYEVPQRVGQ